MKLHQSIGLGLRDLCTCEGAIPARSFLSLGIVGTVAATVAVVAALVFVGLVTSGAGIPILIVGGIIFSTGMLGMTSLMVHELRKVEKSAAERLKNQIN